MCYKFITSDLSLNPSEDVLWGIQCAEEHFAVSEAQLIGTDLLLCLSCKMTNGLKIYPSCQDQTFLPAVVECFRAIQEDIQMLAGE